MNKYADITKHTLGSISKIILGEHRTFALKEIIFRKLGPNAGNFLAKFCGLGFPEDFAQKKILFIHIPRTGGNSLAIGLYGRRTTHHSAAYFNAMDPKVFQKSFKFCFVRNPYDRAVSAYHLLLAGKGENVEVWGHRKYAELAVLSFDQFVQDWLWPRRNRLIWEDVCLWPQTFFTHSEDGKLLIDFLGRWENADEDIQYLFERHDVAIQKIRVNVSLNRETNNFRGYYRDPKSLEVIKQIYADDFKLLSHMPPNAKIGLGTIRAISHFKNDGLP